MGTSRSSLINSLTDITQSVVNNVSSRTNSTVTINSVVNADMEISIVNSTVLCKDFTGSNKSHTDMNVINSVSADMQTQIKNDLAASISNNLSQAQSSGIGEAWNGISTNDETMNVQNYVSNYIANNITQEIVSSIAVVTNNTATFPFSVVNSYIIGDSCTLTNDGGINFQMKNAVTSAMHTSLTNSEVAQVVNDLTQKQSNASSDFSAAMGAIAGGMMSLMMFLVIVGVFGVAGIVVMKVLMKKNSAPPMMYPPPPMMYPPPPPV